MDPGTTARAPIDGARGGRYTVTGEDEDKAILVTVGFTDDAGNEESLESYALAVTPPPALAGSPDPTPWTPIPENPDQGSDETHRCGGGQGLGSGCGLGAGGDAYLLRPWVAGDVEEGRLARHGVTGDRPGN